MCLPTRSGPTNLCLDARRPILRAEARIAQLRGRDGATAAEADRGEAVAPAGGVGARLDLTALVVAPRKLRDLAITPRRILLPRLLRCQAPFFHFSVRSAASSVAIAAEIGMLWPLT